MHNEEVRMYEDKQLTHIIKCEKVLEVFTDGRIINIEPTLNPKGEIVDLVLNCKLQDGSEGSLRMKPIGFYDVMSMQFTQAEIKADI